MLGDRVSRGLLRECLDRERFATKRTILLGSSKNAWGKRGRGDGGGGVGQNKMGEHIMHIC